jgi:hypothetical protein
MLINRCARAQEYPPITKKEQEQQAGAGDNFLHLLAAPAPFL